MFGKNDGQLATATRKEESWIRAGAIFAACFFTTLLFPFIAMGFHQYLPNQLANILFFFPQYEFPYGGLVVQDGSFSRAVFSAHMPAFLNIAQWMLMAALFAWRARRVRLPYLGPLAAVTILVMIILVQLCFRLIGIQLELDSP